MKYVQGLYKIKNKEKYIGNVNEIVFRSRLELRYFIQLDNNPDIIKWASEEFHIPYMSPIDNRMHRYFVDLYVEHKNVSGQIIKYVIEIKPDVFTKPPKVPKRKTQLFVESVKNYSINMAKWKYAKEFCKKRKWSFIILTDKTVTNNLFTRRHG